MSSPSKGGRGKKAPYSTNLCRVPEPIKESVERFAAAYRILAFDGDLKSCRNLINSVDDATASLGEAEDEIKRLKLEVGLANARIEALENERESAITNLLTAFSLSSREGVKMKTAIVSSFPEIQERYQASKKSKQEKIK
jgi:hypothetical protein